MRLKSMTSRHNASGSVLLIAVVLLLLAGVMTVLAMNVGIFEQRSTANDVRAKAVHEVAEAGLAQGAEYLLRQNPGMFTTFTTFPDTATADWAPCADEITFPCGSISTALIDIDGDPATTATVTRKSTMYRLNNTGASITGLDAALVSRMLPMTQTISSVGTGFPVAYGVAPVMCFVANRSVNEPRTSPIRCATTAAEASERRIVTFVSVAALTGESARTTLTQTVGRYPLLATPTGKPPVVASGSVDVNGGLQIVTNPNSGGTGVAISVWSRRDVAKTGTTNTCYADEFFRYLQGISTPSFEGTGENKTIVCDDCKCDAIGAPETLSFDSSGAKQEEGIDILDVEGTSADRGTGTNFNVRSDATSYPTCEFPPDLFANLFGTQAWEDLDNDCFAETKVMKDFENPNTGVVVNMGADEAFLYQNAKRIFGAANGTPLSLSTVEQRTGPSYPSAALSGLIWCQSSCDIGSNLVLGSVDKPVVLVADVYNTSSTSDAAAMNIRGKVYGIVFVRSRHQNGSLTPASYSINAFLSLGGNGLVKMNAGSVIYGSLVVQGQVARANGSAAIVYNQQVLLAIGRDPDNSRFATLPGAWNDRSTY